MQKGKLLFINWIFVLSLICGTANNAYSQKRSNDVTTIKSKKYKSGDYSIDKHKKTHRITKQWLKTYRRSHLNKKNSHKRYVRQLKGWECPSYKTFVYLRKKKLF